MSSYTPITKESLSALILIEIRKKHTAMASKELIINGIIPRAHVDKLLKADILNGKLADASDFTDDQRIAKINELLQKHCFASTACLINELCTN